MLIYSFPLNSVLTNLTCFLEFLSVLFRLPIFFGLIAPYFSIIVKASVTVCVGSVFYSVPGVGLLVVFLFYILFFCSSAPCVPVSVLIFTFSRPPQMLFSQLHHSHLFSMINRPALAPSFYLNHFWSPLQQRFIVLAAAGCHPHPTCVFLKFLFPTMSASCFVYLNKSVLFTELLVSSCFWVQHYIKCDTYNFLLFGLIATFLH